MGKGEEASDGTRASLSTPVPSQLGQLFLLFSTLLIRLCQLAGVVLSFLTVLLLLISINKSY